MAPITIKRPEASTLFSFIVLSEDLKLSMRQWNRMRSVDGKNWLGSSPSYNSHRVSITSCLSPHWNYLS